MSTKFAFTPIPPSRSDDAEHRTGAAALAGTWHGRFIDQDGASEAFTLLRETSVDAAVAGRFLFFSSASVAPTGVRLLEANERAFVALIGPYYDTRQQAEVVTVLEGIRNGTVIEGMWYTRLHNWRETLREGRFVARASETRHRAA